MEFAYELNVKGNKKKLAYFICGHTKSKRLVKQKSICGKDILHPAQKQTIKIPEDRELT